MDIDEALIEEARSLLGTSSTRETIDRALREVVRGAARRREIRALADREGLDLAGAYTARRTRRRPAPAQWETKCRA